MKHQPISRRTALRGLGTIMALPMLEAMLPARESSGTAAPLRMAFVYAPNGKHMAAWSPKAEGKDFELSPILEPLGAVRDDLLVLSGLSLRKADGNGDGPGDHARAMATFLTGCQARKTDGADLRAGISVDQKAAGHVGRLTRFASLELGCEGGRNGGTCDHGYSCAYQTNLSWRSESTPVGKEIDPRRVFDRLFGSTIQKGKEEDAARRERDRRSVLDFVAEDAKGLADRLGSADRRKLDEYLTGVRELEQRIVRAQPMAEVGQSRMVRPTGTPQDFREHARLMADLSVLAFRADLTRIATLVLANDGSNRSYREIGVAEGHHDLSHHGGDPEKQAKLTRINRCHVAQFGYLVEQLKKTKETEASLLDQCIIVYGSGIADGDRHNHDGLPILVAGGGNGTLKTGRHIRCKRDTPLTNLYVSLLDRMGVAAHSFGDSTGPLGALNG